MKNQIVKSIYGKVAGNGFVFGRNVWQHDYRGSNIEVMLGRQGWSTTLNVSHPAFFLEIGKDFKGTFFYQLCYSSGDEGRRRYGFHFNGQIINQEHNLASFARAKARAIKAVKTKFGAELTISNEVQAYSFTASGEDGIDDNDVRLSRVAYCNESRAIFDLATGVALVSFNFDEDLDVSSTKAYTDSVRNYLKDSWEVFVDKDYCEANGLDLESHLACWNHFVAEYDAKQGVEHNLRRFTYLLNNAIMRYHVELRCESPYYVIPRDMSLPDWFLVSDQKGGDDE